MYKVTWDSNCNKMDFEELDAALAHVRALVEDQWDPESIQLWEEIDITVNTTIDVVVG